MKISICVMAPVVLGFGLYGQETGGAIHVPLSDASRPARLKVVLTNGNISVKGYEGKEVLVEPRGGTEARRRGRGATQAEGMHRIDNTSTSVNIEEDNNVVTIGGAGGRSADLQIQVPFNTALSLHGTNVDKILVDHVAGEMEIQNTNGDIIVTNVSGTVLANSTNGKVTVTFDQMPSKAMSFSSFNGNVDVTLPADVKVNVKMKTDNGEIWSDFDVKLEASKPAVVQDNRDKGGRYRVRVDRTMVGTINGGGPELQFTSFNGNLYIRKKK